MAEEADLRFLGPQINPQGAVEQTKSEMMPMRAAGLSLEINGASVKATRVL
jgi:hypothetical protein